MTMTAAADLRTIAETAEVEVEETIVVDGAIRAEAEEVVEEAVTDAAAEVEAAEAVIAAANC